MVKFISKVFVYLWGIATSPSVAATASKGLSTLADLMIVGNLASKEPFIKFGEMVFYVPKKCLGVAKYILEFFKKHKIITTGVLVLLGFSLFQVFRMQLVQEGIKNAKELIKNLFFNHNEITESDDFKKAMNLVEEEFNKNQEFELTPASISSISNGHHGVELKFDLDFDRSGEISVAEYFRGKRIELLLSKCPPAVLELFQLIADYNLDYPDMLKYYGYYVYENDYKKTIS